MRIATGAELTPGRLTSAHSLPPFLRSDPCPRSGSEEVFFPDKSVLDSVLDSVVGSVDDLVGTNEHTGAERLL